MLQKSFFQTVFKEITKYKSLYKSLYRIANIVKIEKKIFSNNLEKKYTV